MNVVTIWLTQRYWHKGCVDCRGKTSSNPLWTSGATTKILGSMTRWDRHTMWQWIMHYFEKLKGVTWLMKVDCHEDQLNTQLNDMIVQTSAMFKGNDKQLLLFAKWFPSHFPNHDWWVPLFGFTSSKRVTSTRYSLLEDKSSLICFTNLREEGFIPKIGLSMFNLTSPLKENSVSFIFRESERIWKKTPWGPFSYDLVSKAQKSVKSYLRELFQSCLAGVFLFCK